MRGRGRRRLSTALLTPAPETTFLAPPIFACPLCSPVRAFLSFFFPPLFFCTKRVSLSSSSRGRQSSELLHSKRRGDSNSRSPKGERSDKKRGKARQRAIFLSAATQLICRDPPGGTHHVVWHRWVDGPGDDEPDGLLAGLAQDGRHLLGAHAPQANLAHGQQVVAVAKAAVLEKTKNENSYISYVLSNTIYP